MFQRQRVSPFFYPPLPYNFVLRQFLSESTQGDKIATYLYFVVRTIQRLFIHDEWSRLTPHDKGVYVSKLFEYEAAAQISYIRRHASKPDIQQKRINKLLQTFRSNHTKMMVSRGHVMKLFEKVSTHLHGLHLIVLYSLDRPSFWIHYGIQTTRLKPHHGPKSLAPYLK